MGKVLLSICLLCLQETISGKNKRYDAAAIPLDYIIMTQRFVVCQQ